MIKVRGASRLLIILALVATGLGLSASPAAAAPALVVSKTTGLLQWEIVTVTGSGFESGERLLITQCIGDVPTSCAMNPYINRNGVYAAADDAGTVSATLRLDRTLSPPEIAAPGGSCEHSDCSIVAIARDDTTERARTFIDFEATGTAPEHPAGTTQVETTDAGPTSADVTVSGSGFQPWFLASEWYYAPNNTRIDLAE